MNAAKHTPGPWSVERSEAPFNQLQVCNEDLDIVVAHVCFVDEANAHLIAAAPDLKEQGQMLSDAARNYWDDLPIPIRARILELDKAIAKAEGKGE